MLYPLYHIKLKKAIEMGFCQGKITENALKMRMLGLSFTIPSKSVSPPHWN